MDTDFAVALGKAARQARTALGLTQEKMAERLGVSVEFYGRIERGVSLPSIETFACMVEVLGVRAGALLDVDALPATRATSSTRAAPADPPELRHLLPMLREARPATLRVVRLLLDEREQAAGCRERARARGSRKPSSKGT